MMKICDSFRVWAALLTVNVIFPQFIWAKLCSDVLSRDVIQEVEYKEPCIQKYTARCGWLSLNYCTFYHLSCKSDQCPSCTPHKETLCPWLPIELTVKADQTVWMHKLIWVFTGEASSFLVNVVDVENSKTTTKSPGYVFISNGGNHSHKVDIQAVKQNPEKKEIEISTGGYAGIICGFLLICAVTFFIIRAIRKRQKRKPRKPRVPANIEYMATALPSSPKSTLPETMPLASPLSLSIAARSNKNSNQDEACTPLSEGPVELAESAGEHSGDVTEFKDIPESNV